MKGSTNAELRKIIEEDIGNFRAEVRESLGNIYGDVRLLDERFCADLRSITGENKDILRKIDKIRDTQNHLIDMVNLHEKEIDKLQMLAEPMKIKIPTECKWIGYLCKFKDFCDQDWQHYDILESVDEASTDGKFVDRLDNHWRICEVICLTDKKIYKEE